MPGDVSVAGFDSLREKVGRFDLRGRTLLMPPMAPFASRLLAASFRAFGAPAVVLETYTGLLLGREFTSGKECFPCQITLGDILHHLAREKERLGAGFSPEGYAYFLPEAGGPCRFGMYNRFQRLVLDRFPDYREIPIVSMSTEDAYDALGMLPARHRRPFRKLALVAVMISDAMDRMVWRARPYESRPGAVDAAMAAALAKMIGAVEKNGARLDFGSLYDLLEETAGIVASLVDRGLPRRPLISVIGEIYLRSHPASNGEIIRQIEDCGGEVVNASMSEWISYLTYNRARKLRRRLVRPSGGDGGRAVALGRWLGQEAEKLYMGWRQRQVYARVRRRLDIMPDHAISTLERRLDGDRLFSFDIGTEAALSIGAAMEHVREGFDGVINVYPFTCMPGTVASAILRPLLRRQGVPYLDAPCDGTAQPNREAALRTFIYQARQRWKRRFGGEGILPNHPPHPPPP